MADLSIYMPWRAKRFEDAFNFYSNLEPAKLGNKRPEWYAMRAVHVGGSDIAPLLDLSVFQTALSIFNGKTMRAEPFGGNFDTRLGTELESFIAHELTHTLDKVVLTDPIDLESVEHPWRAVQIDQTCTVDGKKYLIECKKATRSRHWGQGSEIQGGVITNADPQVPDYYLVQCLYQLAVARECGVDVDSVLLCAWFPTEHEIKIYKVDYDEELCAGILKTADEFVFNNLIPDIEPEASESEMAEALKMVQTQDDDFVENVDVLGIATELLDVNAKIKSLTESKKALEDSIKAVIAEKAGVTAGGRLVATWRSRCTNVTDLDALFADHPELAGKYQKERISRTFSLKLK